MSLQNKTRIFPENWNQVGSDPMKTTKIVSLAVVSIVLLAIDWVLINSVLVDKQPIEFWVWPIVVTILWISSLGFFILVNNNKVLHWTVHALGLVSYLLIMPKDTLVILAGVIFVLLSLWFQQRVKGEEKARQNFSANRVLSAGLGVIIYAWLIVLGFNIYFATDAEFKTNPEVYYDRIISSAIKSVEFTTDILIDELLPAQLNEQGVGGQALNDSITETTAGIVTEQVTQLLDRYDRFLPIIFTLIVMGLFRTFAFVFRWVALLINWILFRILLLTGFFQMKKSQVEIEKLEV